MKPQNALLLVILSAPLCIAEERTSTALADDLAAGHSRHGEVFNEGPRQQAYLMPGTGKIEFEVQSDVVGVQAFVEQGIGQLHGFWYFEAERSFRQAAMLDPQCAIAYWGMAKANANNEERAKELAEKALALREHASEREQLYITSLHTFLTGEGKKKEREKKYVEAVEAIVEQYPDDVEAKGLLGYVLYKHRGSADRTHAEVDVVLDQVLAKSKLHPVHHYRIHLWDHKSPQRALDSAARCGPSAPGIAHMWHMCGHIFSRVKRYGDAAWFQEASARVDHRHMMHDRVLPDQIHNFAHNNEWFIRNMMHVGRVGEALELAKNMIELPRHPKYNVLSKRKSAAYGRDRLLNVLERFELWDETIKLARGAYLEPTDEPEEQLKRLRLLGKALAQTDQLEFAETVLEDLKQTEATIKADEPSMDRVAADDEPKEEDEDPKDRDKRLEKELKKRQEEHERLAERATQAIASVEGYLALARGEVATATKLLEEAEEDELALARVQSLAGDHEAAVAAAQKYAKGRPNQVPALVGLVEILWQAGKMTEAREAFVDLRANSNWIELGSPIFARLTPIARDLGLPVDWRVEQPPARDLGDQPELSTLGPFRWQPPPAPDWLLPDSKGNLHSLRGRRGKPVLLVFYLGYGCLHCAEQLQALAPMTEEFQDAGIDIVAISTDSLKDLDISVRNYDGKAMPFPLVSDDSMDVFRSYRCFDDFEDAPLHGTYLIDGDGRVRWQDISYEPFMELEFLLEESRRLLRQAVPPQQAPANELARSESE